MDEPQTEDTSSLQAVEAGCSEATTNDEDCAATSEGNVNETFEETGNESRTVSMEENPSVDENTLENNDDTFLDEQDNERRDESMDKEYTGLETDNTLFSPTADENKTTADQTEHENEEQDGNDQLNESLTECVSNSADVENMEEEQGLETEDLLLITGVDEETLQQQNAVEGELTEDSNDTLNNMHEDNTPGDDDQPLLQEVENGEQDESLSQLERNSASDVLFEPTNKEEHDIEQFNVSTTESEKPENDDRSVKVPDEISTLESERLLFEQTEDKNDLIEYKNDATESGDREQTNTMQTDRELSANGAGSVLDQYENENQMLQQETSDLKMENSRLYSQIQDDGKSPALNGSTEGDERPARSDYLMDEDISEDPIPTGNYYTDDDFSSIFSDDDRDMSDILQENKILKEAMRQLKKNDISVITDTVSETSDDFDDMYPYNYAIGGDSKIKRSAWMAGKDLSDAKYNEVLREKRDTEAKMRQLEREKAMMERKYKQDKMERDFMEDRYNLKSAKLEDEVRNLRQENQRLRQTGQQEKVGRPTTGPKKYGSEKDIGFNISSDNEDNVPAGKNGYAIDIAVLAKENEKLSEIIDHLQLNTSTPRNDSVNDFVEAMERYVPKEEFIRVESEKRRLETVVREKERAVKELERLMDEIKFDLEEENMILKDSFKKAENKNKEKTRLLSDYDLQMVDIKAKCAEKLGKVEKDLHMEISKKMKLENVILNLKKCNENFENEIQDMNNRIIKLQNQEAKLEDKHRREITGLEERLRKEIEEKNKLGRNVEALLQDLMHLKNKMLEEAEKHAREREQLRSSFESEKLKILAELGDEKKRSEQLIRRMAEIPGETIVAVMEGKTESGCYEGTFNDNEFEPGAFDRAFQDEQEKDPAMENVVMALNDLRGRSGSQTPNTIKSVEECLGDISKLQKKLTEATKFNGAVQRRNKEIEEENIYLKEKIERVGKDMSKMRELEDKNEELQEEIARNAKKRNEMQKRQENMTEEIEKMTSKLHEMEENNYHLSDEVERLTKKIKNMEKEFSEERSKLTSSMERERSDVISETEKRVDEQKSKNKKLEDEIDDLRSDIKALKDAKRAAEEKYVDDTKELIERHNAELTRERGKYTQLQDELNNNAGAVRKVTEEWEQMLRNAISRYEEDLQKNEDERRKLAAEFQGQKEEMKAKFDKEKRNLELRIQEIEKIGLVSASSELNMEHFEGLYKSYQNETHMEAPSNGIAERQDKIRALMAQQQNLEERLQQMQKNHDNEKNDLYKEHKKEKQKLEEMIEEEYKRKLEESKRYYEGQLDDLRRKHEKEKEDLEYKFKRETRDMQEKMKHEFTSGLSSRSPELENKIQDLVSSKVQEQKDISKKLEMQLRTEKEKNNTVLMHMKNKMQNEKSELKRRFDREKKVLEATVQALTKELAKLKQEKKELKKKQKKERAEMEEAFENEKKEMKQMWEKCKLDTITQIEDEWSEKLISERARLEMDKDEVRVVFEAKIKELKLKLKSEKAEYESRLKMVTSESNSLAEAKKEIQAALADEYRRKLQKEKENIESTLQGLRQEIQRLQEHRKQLQSQMTNREGHFKDNAQPAPESPSKLLSKLDQEYQEYMKREKQQHEGRMKDMETEIQKLHDDLSEMKVKARQEKSRLKNEFEREREEIEEQFDRERNDWRRRMAFISAMQPRDQKRSADRGHHDPRQ